MVGFVTDSAHLAKTTTKLFAIPMPNSAILAIFDHLLNSQSLLNCYLSCVLSGICILFHHQILIGNTIESLSFMNLFLNFMLFLRGSILYGKKKGSCLLDQHGASISGHRHYVTHVGTYTFSQFHPYLTIFLTLNKTSI